MTSLGRYHPAGDVPGYDLPQGWTPTEPALLEAALDRALGAWDGQEVDRVTRYYDPESDYAGNLLTSIPTSADDDIDAADLVAPRNPGRFSFADPPAAVRDRLGPDRLEASDLRLLDVVLWTKGIGHWRDTD